jgi:outer membrane lipoprotein-sorting protein
MDDEDFLSNPAKILSWYNRDFKYKYAGTSIVDGNEMHEIDLFPNNLNQPYSRIKVHIAKKDALLYMIMSYGKDGIDYSIRLHDYITNRDLDDVLFSFDPEKFRKAEIVDMRF